jgi:hypothetical protein
MSNYLCWSAVRRESDSPIYTVNGVIKQMPAPTIYYATENGRIIYEGNIPYPTVLENLKKSQQNKRQKR